MIVDLIFVFLLFLSFFQARNKQRIAEDMRKEWEADREKIQRVILNIFWIMKIVFILKDIRRDFQSEKEKMQIESEKQRNELEKKLQYGEEEKCF